MQLFVKLDDARGGALDRLEERADRCVVHHDATLDTHQVGATIEVDLLEAIAAGKRSATILGGEDLVLPALIGQGCACGEIPIAGVRDALAAGELSGLDASFDSSFRGTKLLERCPDNGVGDPGDGSLGRADGVVDEALGGGTADGVVQASAVVGVGCTAEAVKSGCLELIALTERPLVGCPTPGFRRFDRPREILVETLDVGLDGLGVLIEVRSDPAELLLEFVEFTLCLTGTNRVVDIHLVISQGYLLYQ
ncbi:hypothetical protein [Ensifer sp. ENS04]|uniref:hypothetical protein n=1 Tax=Ensifer sp. ENS04 TaxID=2769281 RepID=UPI001FEF9B0F|nr:hypothetical protein [Ensifer sp. ENS04]